MPVPTGLTAATEVSAGDDFTCAIESSQVFCWGANMGGLGDPGATTHRSVPTMAPGLTGVRNLSCAGNACCVQRGTDTLCWGLTFESYTPTTLAVDAESFALGDRHACFVAEGTMRCLGPNANGQLGDGTTTTRSLPTTVALAAVESGEGGNVHTCARAADGGVWCWGRSHRGQVGNGLTSDELLPVRVLDDATAIGVGHALSCAISHERVFCWGINESGAAGDGTLVDVLVPTEVVSPL